MNDCFYCEKGKTLDDLMIPLCELEYSHVYLPKNQNYPGRSVVVCKNHQRELYDLSPEERRGFVDEVAMVARAVGDLYQADKINYGIYGDNVPHLHCHVIPKHRGGYTWGTPFALGGNDNYPEMAELEQTALRIREKIAEGRA